MENGRLFKLLCKLGTINERPELVIFIVVHVTSYMLHLHCRTCYKLLERLALQRISTIVEGLLSPDQAGFQKGRNTCDPVAALTTFIWLEMPIQAPKWGFRGTLNP